jgi:hypothetical protein
MKKIAIEILPLLGLPDLKFGEGIEQAEYVFGKPEETEEFDDEEFEHQTIVYYYWDLGITLFFKKTEKPYLIAIETDDLKATLLDKKVFQMNEKALIEFFATQKMYDFETEVEDWGEKRLTWDAWNIDFYFDGKELSTINWSEEIEKKNMD